MKQAATVGGALCDYFEQCPPLHGKNADLDFLPEDKNAFCVDMMPSETVVTHTMRGGGLRQAVFLLRTRTEQNEDALRRIDNSGMFEALADWLAEQTRWRKLPQLPPGKVATKLEALTTGYRYTTDNAAAGIYQIECRLTYLQR